MAEDARPLRADARRNREAIIEAADVLFQQGGIAVGMDEIAAAAGVGVGTLYRRFPTKETLFMAIARREVDRLISLARQWSTNDDACATFFRYVDHTVREMTARQNLFEALSRTDLHDDGHEELKAALGAAIGVLFSRAIERGCVRADLSVDELLSLLMGTCMAVGKLGPEPGGRCHIVDVVCDGLRVRHRGPDPDPDPSREHAGARRAAAPGGRSEG